MHELQWPKLENFIPRDLLEHTRLLRRNFVQINLHVKESPVGAVPNYYYNVLSQQYMDLSEKLLAPPAEDELTAMSVRARVHVAAQLDLGVAVQEEEEEEVEKMVNDGGQKEVVQNEQFSRAENESSWNTEIAADCPNPESMSSPLQTNSVDGLSDERISSPLQKDAAGMSNLHLIPSQPREEAIDRLNPSVIPSQPLEKAAEVPRSPCQPQENAVNIRDPHATRNQLQELEVSSIPLGIDPEDHPDKEIYVTIPVLTSLTSTDSTTPEILLEAYGVMMKNMRKTNMHVGTENAKLKVRKRLVAQNQPRTSSIRDIGDIRHIERIGNAASKTQQDAIILEFRTPEQANEVIKIGLDWYGRTYPCQKYARNCKPRQCSRCQAYGHGKKQCALLPRCLICSGQHSASQCSNTTQKCALCGGNHCANSSLCPKLAAERIRVKNRKFGKGQFWPVNDTVEKMSKAAPKPLKSVFPQASPADRLSSMGTHTVLPDLSYEELSSQSKSIWPAVWQSQDIIQSKPLATCRLTPESPEPSCHPSAREKTAKKALKPVSGNQPKETLEKKRRRSKSSSTGKQDREKVKRTRIPSSRHKGPTAALVTSSWSAVAHDEKEYW